MTTITYNFPPATTTDPNSLAALVTPASSQEVQASLRLLDIIQDILIQLESLSPNFPALLLKHQLSLPQLQAILQSPYFALSCQWHLTTSSQPQPPISTPPVEPHLAPLNTITLNSGSRIPNPIPDFPTPAQPSSVPEIDPRAADLINRCANLTPADLLARNPNLTPQLAATLAANINRIPPHTLQWLSNPANQRQINRYNDGNDFGYDDQDYDDTLNFNSDDAIYDDVDRELEDEFQRELEDDFIPAPVHSSSLPFFTRDPVIHHPVPATTPANPTPQQTQPSIQIPPHPAINSTPLNDAPPTQFSPCQQSATAPTPWLPTALRNAWKPSPRFELNLRHLLTFATQSQLASVPVSNIISSWQNPPSSVGLQPQFTPNTS